MPPKSAETRKELICQLMKEPSYVPMREKELACIMQVEREDREEFARLLQELLLEGKIQVNKRGRYSVPSKPPVIGTFIGHRKGFGFVEIEGKDQALYIPETMTNGAWHQDTVEVRLLGRKNGPREEAEVVRILERGIRYVVGTYQKNRGFGFLIPDNSKLPSDIFIPLKQSGDAVDGTKAVAEILDYGGKRRSPEGRISEILGHMNEPGVDILSVVRSYDIPSVFPQEALDEANRFVGMVEEKERKGRRDLRSLLMVTIDGEEAKDLDDAVSLHMEDGNYCLGVHIADVSEYVQEGTALDREALKRGTSVYLADRVIPMLPPALSNGICSLNEGEERLALSCLMTVNPKGEVIDYSIEETVIQVNRRLTYTSVAAILESEDRAERERYEELLPMLFRMAELSALIRKRRQQRGAIDFDFAESKIRLDGRGRPVAIIPQEKNTATRLIEDFMLLANETVAQHFYWLSLPFLYRSHESPSPDKMHDLSVFVQNLGYSLKGIQSDVHPKELQKLLAWAKGRPEEALIDRMTLRSMRQARYTVQCGGHFGLAGQYYCHFTSPIRRYPDLQIHRIIKEQLHGRLDEGRIKHYEQILDAVAIRTSKAERRADEAEREVERMKKAEFMQQRIGEIATGIISGITAWGLYVELPNSVEGLIHISELPGDYFYFEEGACEMRGEYTGICYRLGETVEIRVKSADPVTRTIDFVLAEGMEAEENGERSAETDREQ